jgi:hypothetical protein
MQRRLVWVPIASALGAYAAALPLIIAQTTLDRQTRLVPGLLADLLDALAFAGVLGAFIYIGLFSTMLRQPLKQRTRTFRWLFGIGTILGGFVVSLAIIASILVTDPHFLDGGLIAKSPSPDGERTAYAYGTFMCGVEIYVAEPGDHKMAVVDHLAPRCGSADNAHIVWTNDRPQIVGADGQPLVTESWNLYLGPH